MIRTILRNIVGLRGRYTGFAIAVAVLVGAGSAGLVISDNAPTLYEQQLDGSTSNRTIVVQAPVGSGTRIDDATISALGKIPGVATVEPTYALSGDLPEGSNANVLTMTVLPLRSTFAPPLITGTAELGARDALIPEVVDGRSMHDAIDRDITILRNVAVRPGETKSQPETLHVVGLIEQYWQVDGRNPVYIRSELARSWLSDATGLGPNSVPPSGFGSAAVLAGPDSDPQNVLAAIQTMGLQASTAAQVGGEVPESLQSFVGLSQVIRLIGIVVGLVVAFVFVRTILLSRLPEVGLLTSLGYSSKRIVATIGGEVLLVALLGAVIGIGLGSAAAFAVTTGLGTDRLPPGAALILSTPSLLIIAQVVIATTIVVALAAAIPLTSAARKPALVALRTRK